MGRKTTPAKFRYLGLPFLLLMILPKVLLAGGYKLGPADVVSISIFAGGENQVAVELTLSADGNVNFPYLGPVKASEMTTQELEEKVTIPLAKDYFVDPQVHIRVKEYHSQHFSISGAIEKPGKYEMTAETTIMDLIAKAQGVTLESGKIAYVLRDEDGNDTTKKQGLNSEGSGREPIKINLVKLLDEGDMSKNIILRPGDSVYIPHAKGLHQAQSKVYVSGRVKKAGLYEFQPGMTALSACIMAGGFDKYAAANRTTIVRQVEGEQKVIKIDLEDVIEGRVTDVVLKPGDRVNVPESWL